MSDACGVPGVGTVRGLPGKGFMLSEKRQNSSFLSRADGQSFSNNDIRGAFSA
jgi:hypothetical protein